MQILRYFFLFCGVLLATTGCTRSSDQVWEDAHSCSNHFRRGVGSLCGQYQDSRQVRSKDDFYRMNRNCPAYARTHEEESDFYTLPDDEPEDLLCMAELPASKYSPGEQNSPIPGIESFKNPASDPYLSRIFRPIFFGYNSNAVEGTQNLETLEQIAYYMNKNPQTYIFVEGHCDERGSQSYNLALGMRRAQEIRSQLVAYGINPDRIFTISYGKEKPMVQGHDVESWGKNRRGEFKVYP